MITVKCLHCDREVEVEDEESRLPGAWISLGAWDDYNPTPVMSVSSTTANPMWAITVRVPKMLTFCTRHCASAWLNIAVENLLHRGEIEAEDTAADDRQRRNEEHDLALEMNMEFDEDAGEDAWQEARDDMASRMHSARTEQMTRS